MALTIPEQIHERTQQSTHVLICFGKNYSIDAIASSIALARILKKIGKAVDIACDGFHLPTTLNFLADEESIQPTLTHLQKFLIKIDVQKTKVEDLSYDVQDDTLTISITPKHGTLSSHDVRFSQSQFRYDLIWVLDTTDLESLGTLYEENTELFYRTPTIAVDHNPANEHFGHINVLELTATSTAEVLLTLLETIHREHIDEKVATALLTGMIAKTKSFKTKNVTPKTLATASKLMHMGADREKIIHHLYRTRSIAALKLWGNALQHLKNDPLYGLVWTSLTREDFIRTKATEEELPDIIDELMVNTPEAKVVVLLYERTAKAGEHGHGNICAIIRSEKPLDSRMLTQSFNPTGDQETVRLCFVGKHLGEAEQQLIQNLQQALKAIPTI